MKIVKYGKDSIDFGEFKSVSGMPESSWHETFHEIEEFLIKNYLHNKNKKISSIDIKIQTKQQQPGEVVIVYSDDSPNSESYL